MQQNIFKSQERFYLENGRTLPNIEISYTTYGTLNAEASNVVWICHALTANSEVHSWWEGLVGDGKSLDPQKDFIVCANILGSCYGSTGPFSFNTDTNSIYYSLFPELTVRDVVKAHQLLANWLKIDKIKLLIGGSLGGQQALEWSIIEPDRIEQLFLIATNAFHSPWGIAFNETQRMAILADRSYYGNSKIGGEKGLMAARAIALLSYRIRLAA